MVELERLTIKHNKALLGTALHCAAGIRLLSGWLAFARRPDNKRIERNLGAFVCASPDSPSPGSLIRRPVRCQDMSDLFSGIPVKDFVAASRWYEQLLGGPPDFFPHDTEAVWKLAEHQYIYIVQIPERAGQAILMQMVDDLDAHILGITNRGLKYSNQEYFSNEMCKVTYSDPDGNQISFDGLKSAPSKDT